jgi:hypothetical protein
MTIVTVPLAGQYGVIKDQPPHELPINAWSDSANIRFREGGAERFRGEKKLFETPAVIPYWLQQYNQGGKRWWIHAGLAALYADDGVSARSNITPASPPTGTVDDRWTGGVLNGVMVANNGKDIPISWGGSGLMTNLTAWPATTRVASLRPYKNVLVGLDVTKNVGTTNNRFPHMVKWSDTAVPGSLPSSYDETDLTRLAGELDLAEEPSLMVDQLTLGDANIIYKEASMWSMVPTGDTANVFRFQRLPGEVGALARGCIANTPRGHVVLTPGDVILHAGQGPKSIITSLMRRWLFNNIDGPNRKRTFVTVNPASNEVWVCFPELGAEQCTMAAVWNWEDNHWSIRTLNNVTYAATGQLDYTITSTWAANGDMWQDASSAWNQDELSPAQSRLLTCGASPLIVGVDVSATFNGSTYTSRLERKGLHYDKPDQVKLIKAVYPRIDAAVGTQVQIQVGGTMDIEAAVNWSDPVTYTVGSSYKADAFASGRFLAIRYQSLDNQPWRIRSQDHDIQMMGGY